MHSWALERREGLIAASTKWFSMSPISGWDIAGQHYLAVSLRDRHRILVYFLDDSLEGPFSGSSEAQHIKTILLEGKMQVSIHAGLRC